MKTMVKKFWSILLALVLLAALMPAAAYAAPPAEGDDGHIHRWRKTEEQEPTCTEEGYVLYECGDPSCTETPYREVTADALGHSWDEGEVTKEATCSEEGEKTLTCTRCGETKTESIPKLEHTPEVLPAKEATCTEPGLTEGKKCSVCEEVLTAQEEIPATGHRWDEGKVVKKPSGLSQDGEKLYTCLNNPSHTRTEVIPAGSDIFSMMRMTPRNIPPGNPLRIVRQPEGGSIVRYLPGKLGHTFTVEAAGGAEPYSYEWHAVNEAEAAAFADFAAGIDGSAASKITALIAGKTQEKGNAHRGFITGWHDSFPAVAGIELPAMPDEKSQQFTLFTPGDKIVSHDASCTTTGGGRTYYCIITDDAGVKVETDHVALDYGLSISKQPVNCNAETKDEAPFVEAVDGTPPYSYDWYLSENGQDVLTDDHDSVLNAKQNGDYYCIVTDNAGAKVQSDTISVYFAPALEIAASSKSAESVIDGQETVELDVYVKGGVPPYSACYMSWADGWVDVEAQEYTGSEYEAEYHFPVTVDEADTYDFMVEDSRGKKAVTTIELPYNQLKIKRQLWYSVIPGKETRMADLEMEEGKFPLTYELYRIEPGWDEDGFTDGLLVDSYTDDSLTGKFEIGEEGLYYVIITDSTGRWARTETIGVSIQYIRVSGYTNYVQVENDDRAAVLQTKVTGKNVTGVNAVTFDWFRINEKEGGMQPIDQTDPYVAVLHNVNFFTEGERTGLENRIEVTMPGHYVCIATDLEGHMACTGDMWVNYVSPNPYFVIQPQSVKIPGDTERPKATLACEAVSGDDNVRTAGNSQLIYTWEKNEGGYWKPVPVDSAETKTLELLQEYDNDPDAEGTLPVISGRYRCEAFEPSTSRRGYSNTAVVEHTLEFGHYNARINRDGSADIAWTVRGGFQPYDIKVYTDKWVRTGKNSSSWELRTEEYPLKDGWYSLTSKEGKVTLAIYSVPSYRWREENGKKVMYPAKYTIRVNAAGQTVMHDVEFTMDGKYTGKERE